MKARVHVSFKPTVLDPQGQTIQKALQGLGHKSIAGVRQGKFFEIELNPGSVQDKSAKEKAARNIPPVSAARLRVLIQCLLS